VASFYGQGLSAVRSQFWKPAQTLQARLLAPVPAQLHDRIRFLGAQPHDRLADLYRAADMLVQPSVCREGYGLPVAEAMAVGLPVVAANHGGLLDLVVPGETGLLVPPGDVAALADAIETLLREPARAHAFGTAGRTRALRCFTWRRAALRLAEVYRDVCR
jgi:glycosyltransferase involved in cell wall biosynthesis